MVFTHGRFAITFALWQRAMALVQFHILKVTRFVYGGDVKTFRCSDEPNGCIPIQAQRLASDSLARHADTFVQGDLTHDDLDAIDVWQTQPSVAMLTSLREFLPRNTSWGPCEEFESETETWSSDLRIWHHDDSRQSVRSIDFRFSGADGFPLLSSFIQLMADYYCHLFSIDTSVLLPPNYDTVVADFLTTRAARFMVDPKSTIIEAANELNPNRRTT